MCEACVDHYTRGHRPPMTDPMWELAGQVWDWYQLDGNDTGGVLHVVLDDYNVEDRCLDYCEPQLGWMWDDGVKVVATEQHRKAGAEIIAGLRALTEPARAVVIRHADVYASTRPTRPAGST